MLLVTLSIITIIILKDNKQEIKLDNVKLNEVNETQGLALMIEQTNGTYEETTDTEWPTDGYSFNKHMSGCIDSNGNTIENTLTYKNGAIKLKTKHNTYCYIYFDIDRPATEELLATVSSEQLWNSILEDDGYRYVGTNPDNYICFGTNDQEECKKDTDKYMYRIIGIFEDENGVQHIKLIKKEALNSTYQWHADFQNDVDWDESDLYKGINGSYFATNSDYSYMQDSAWNNLITYWDYTMVNTKTYESSGLNYYDSVTVQNIYLHELNRSSKISTIGEWKTVTSKVGLMYVSDYILSLGKETLNYKTSNNSNELKTGWIHLSNNDKTTIETVEWTTSRYGFNDNSFYYSLGIYWYGYINIDYVNDSDNLVRPTFYLESDTKLDKGAGTIDNPYTIEISPNLREYCEEYNNINECIKNEENNIEEVSDLWNSTLEDDGIRYVGTNPNNYVCFGTTNTSECTNDTDKYMYRIIGIFEDSEGNQHLKLIKKEALNSTYQWHSSNLNIDWEESDLYKGINESYFLTNFTSYPYMKNEVWKEKISLWNYIATNTLTDENNINNNIYGLYYNDNTPKVVYLHEMNKTDKMNHTCYYDSSTQADCSVGEWKMVNAKIGLMYASDYMLSLGKGYLDTSGTNYYDVFKTGWLHLEQNDSNLPPSAHEWTMTRHGIDNYGIYLIWRILSAGYVNLTWSDNAIAARPVFYLTENIKITSGKGSVIEPFIIS